MAWDEDRLDTVEEALRVADLDVLACALPANVLLLTGYWPVVGTSVALAARGRRTILIVPEDERDLARQGRADEILTFRPGAVDELRTAEVAVREPLARAAGSLPLLLNRVGYESGPAFEPVGYAALHLYGFALPLLVREAFGGPELVPADDCLSGLRAVKTPFEVGRTSTACRLAGLAFQSAAEGLRPGLRETEAAALFQAGLATVGSDDPSVGRVGGQAWCMSGPNAARACAAYAISGRRRLGMGEPILVHANSYAGGYWTDITRTYCLGEPSERLRDIYDAVFAAREAALEAIRPGASAAAVDQAARAVLTERGFGSAFKHSTGHGVGFAAINHAAPPRLHLRSEVVLRVGMICNVEPAVYLDGFGGVRHCDVVCVGPTGAHVLTPFQSSVDELILEPAAASSV